MLEDILSVKDQIKTKSKAWNEALFKLQEKAIQLGIIKNTEKSYVLHTNEDIAAAEQRIL